MELRQVIQEAGLADKETDVYLELIKSSGPQPASIISKKIGLNRTTVYKILLKLAKIGLLTKTMKYGITCFMAEEPERSLQKMLIKKQQHLELINSRFQSLIPEIQNMKGQDLTTPNVRYYEGVEGVKRVYEDTLFEGEVIYAFENFGATDPRIKEYLTNEYLPKRIEKNIFTYIITPNDKEHLKYKKMDKVLLRHTGLIPNPFSIDLEINIYGQKTAFFSYKTEEMFAVILESSAITNSMKAIFDVCWKAIKE